MVFDDFQVIKDFDSLQFFSFHFITISKKLIRVPDNWKERDNFAGAA